MSHTTPEILDLDEVADLLGVCPRTIQRWRKAPRRPLPGHSAPDGRTAFFITTEVVDWVRRQSDHIRDTPRSIKRRSKAAAKKRRKARGGR